jgi:hypothetical protein
MIKKYLRSIDKQVNNITGGQTKKNPTTNNHKNKAETAKSPEKNNYDSLIFISRVVSKAKTTVSYATR